MHHLTQASNCCLPTWTFVICSSIPLDVFFVSQLKRCFNISLHELIMSCSIFGKIDSYRVSFYCHHVGWRSQKERRQDQLEQWINIFEKGNRIMKIVSFLTPLSSYFTSWISGRDFCLVGASCHSPRISECNSCISEHASCLIQEIEMMNFQSLINYFRRRARTL